MEVYEAIESRRTVRDFQERKIDREILEKILSAGLKAPSNDHMRSWEFVIVEDLEIRRKVTEKTVNDKSQKEIHEWLDSWGSADPYQREVYLESVPVQQRMLLTAGALVIPFFRQEHPLLEPKSLSGLNGFASIWCCIENMLIAAAAEGIHGVTFVPDDKEIPHFMKVLNVPGNYFPACCLAMGYPAEGRKILKQVEVHIKERMHINGW